MTELGTWHNMNHIGFEMSVIEMPDVLVKQAARLLFEVYIN